MKRPATWVVCFLLGLVLPAARADWMDQFLYRTNANTMPYRLYVPPGYDATNTYPLVLFLHGAGGEGTDNEVHLNNGQSGKLSWLDKGTFIVAPQASFEGGFTAHSNVVNAREIVAEVVSNYSVNARRLYVTGLSRGGKGTWRMCAYYPNVFAAGVPICGWGEEWLNVDPGMDHTQSWAHLLVDIPIWAHHGLDDDVVPPINSRFIYAKIGQAITNAGRAVNTNNLKLTEYPGVNHNSWDPAYGDTNVNAWMFDYWLGETEAPSMPADVTAPTIADNHVVLTWTSPDDPATVEHFDVYRNGAVVAGATATVYRDDQLEPSSNYTYQVAARNHRGMVSPTSGPVAIATLADYKPPEVISVSVLSWNRLQVDFSETIETQLTANPGNYSIGDGVAVLRSALGDDRKSVMLTTTYLSNGTPYVLTVHNAEDLLGLRRHDQQVAFQHHAPWTPLPYVEDFEAVGLGPCLAAAAGWHAAPACAGVVTDDAEILARLTNGYAGSFPVATTHTRVVAVDAGVVTRHLAGDRDATNRYEFMLEPAAWPSPHPPAVDAETQAALYLDPGGHLVLWHGYFDGPIFTTRWTELTHTPIAAPTQWVRIAMTHDTSYAYPFFALELDGSPPLTSAVAYADKAALTGPGAWFLAACTNNRYVSSFSASGCNLDDLAFTTASGRPPEWTLTILALTNGLVTSSNNAAVPDAQDAHFAIQADGYYHIDDLATNGLSMDAEFGTASSYAFTWSNVTGHGTVQAFFAADLTTNTHTPVWWLVRHYGETNYEEVALTDTDGDGLTAAEEHVADTQPTNGGSFFRHAAAYPEAGQVVLRWASASNRVYSIDGATALTGTPFWVAVETALPATPAENVYTTALGGMDARFFRIKVQSNE